MEADLVDLGASELTNNVPTLEAGSPVTGDADLDDVGTIEFTSQLGVSAMPAAANDAGRAQGVILKGVAGRNAVCVGAIDRRNAGIYGNLSPGDTALHATGPDAVSMVLCKAKKRQTVLATKGTDGKQILVVLDGKNDSLKLTAFGHVFEISKKDGLSLTDGKAGIHIKNGTLVLFGKVQFGRKPKPGLAVMLGPKTGSPGGAGSVPLTPLLDVGV